MIGEHHREMLRVAFDELTGPALDGVPPPESAAELELMALCELPSIADPYLPE